MPKMNLTLASATLFISTYLISCVLITFFCSSVTSTSSLAFFATWTPSCHETRYSHEIPRSQIKSMHGRIYREWAGCALSPFWRSNEDAHPVALIMTTLILPVAESWSCWSKTHLGSSPELSFAGQRECFVSYGSHCYNTKITQSGD